MCLTTRALVSRPLASALDSAFFRSCRRNSADLTGHRARETPHCLPVHHTSVSLLSVCDDNRDLISTGSMPMWYSIQARCNPEYPVSCIAHLASAYSPTTISRNVQCRK